MVTIRLQRRGTRKTPHHRLVVMDGRQAQGSRVLEVLGYYNPSTNPPACSVNESRLVHWLSSGARVTEAVQHLLKTLKNIAVKSAR
jgi:small subunit ribosomal protein S16